MVLSRISSTAKTVRTICRGVVKHFYIDFFPFIYENEEKADAITIFFFFVKCNHFFSDGDKIYILPPYEIKIKISMALI